jgi:PAS domain S-box-containing protein
MNWSYAYTPGVWPSLVTVLFLIALSMYSWRRRSVPGALPFCIGSLFAALWSAGSVMEVAAVDVPTKIFWFEFQAVWRLPAITAITCFVLEYAWPGRWLTRRNLVLLCIPPLLVLGLILTNDLHHLAWRGFAYEGKVIPLRGPVNWMLLAYGYGLGIVNLVILAWLFLRSLQHRWPVVIMVSGQIVGRGLFLLEAAQVFQPAAPLDVPPIAFEYLMYAIALFSFHIFDPIPLAHRTAIEQMHAGILVLDPQGQVVSLNPAAERILGAPASSARGQPVRELLPAYPDRQLAENEEIEIELSLPERHRDRLAARQELRHYTLTISLLNDFRGLAVGRLLLLRDVTVQKQAQAQLVEQQRTLATLQERERLARELHDSLGQTLAAAHLQASSARLLLARGQTAETDECLERLASMTIDAEADVREYLLGAKTVLSADLPFFPALRQYLQRFSQQYKLPAELAAPPQLEAQGLERVVEVQLLRIIQEALSNVRKHARAHRADVSFSVSGTLVQITIIDNGQGFDPAAVAARQGDGFGLQSMRERAEALGGRLEVISHPGQGTRVEVHVPVGTRWGDTETGKSAEREMGI